MFKLVDESGLELTQINERFFKSEIGMVCVSCIKCRDDNQTTSFGDVKVIGDYLFNCTKHGDFDCDNVTFFAPKKQGE